MILFYFKPAYFPQKVQLVHMLQVMLKLHIPSSLEGFRGITRGTKKKILGKSAHASRSFPNNHNFYMNHFKCFALTAATNKHSG